MRIIVSGWSRNHGEKEVIDAAIGDLSEGHTYSWGETYLRAKENYPYPPSDFRVSTGAKLNLCGSYLVHVELKRWEIKQLYCQTHSEDDIARLFYRTFGHREMGDIVRLLVSLKDEAEEHTRKIALYRSAIKSLIDESERGVSKSA